MSAAIEITNLHKHYPNAEIPALAGLNLYFPKGEISGLLGPNGAGKTTTISIICSLIKADKGSVRVLGEDINQNAASILRKIGVVTQQIALYPSLTAQENLEYIGRLYQISPAVLKARIAALLSEFGLESARHKQVKHYSGGMKRRCHIIAALLHDPDLIILDEPTAGVDIHSRTMILDFLQSYNASGKTIIYTSHQLEEAERLCKNLAIIDGGKSVAAGTIDDLKRAVPGITSLEDLFLHYTGRSLRE